jgi:hypothetical protein
LNVVEIVVFHRILTDDANSDGNACKASFFFGGKELELCNMVEFRRNWHSLIEWRWDAAGDVAFLQLFNDKRFKHSTLDRCKPRSADEQVAYGAVVKQAN